MRAMPAPRAAAITWPSIGRPATSCITLGIADFIRVPLPAARMIAARAICMVSPTGLPGTACGR